MRELGDFHQYNLGCVNWATAGCAVKGVLARKWYWPRRVMHRRTKVPELVEVERDRDKARSRRKAQPLRFKPVTIGDLLREGNCWRCIAATAGRSGTSISMPAVSICRSGWPVPEVASHLACSRCGAIHTTRAPLANVLGRRRKPPDSDLPQYYRVDLAALEGGAD
jgi:hypothetical protein